MTESTNAYRPPGDPSGADDAQTPRGAKSSGLWIVVALVSLLLVLHQDNWFWTDDTVVLGFLPIGLFWHACISVAAALTWWLATKIAWPFDDNASATGPSDANVGEGQTR